MLITAQLGLTPVEWVSTRTLKKLCAYVQNYNMNCIFMWVVVWK